MNGVFLVCTIYVGTRGHEKEKGYLLASSDVDRRILGAFTGPAAGELFTDEISLVHRIEGHVRIHGENHRDHLALYRADGSLIQGGPTSWKTVLAAGCETIPVAACMEAAQ